MEVHTRIPVAPAGNYHNSFPRKDSLAHTDFVEVVPRRDSAVLHTGFVGKEVLHRDSVDTGLHLVEEACHRDSVDTDWGLAEAFRTPNRGLAPLLFAPDLDSRT